MITKYSKTSLIGLLVGIFGCTNINEPKHDVLDQFYLGYVEWKKVSCEFSSDEIRHSDKAMVGILEKSGKLRIEYLGQIIYLKSDSTVEIKEGQWLNTFKNDTIQVVLSINFDNKHKIMNCITGKGNMNGLINNKPFSENVFGVYQTKDFK
jgi:hypothetical protein